MITTPLRERVLHLIREERKHQIEEYGNNDDLLLGFGSSVSAYPWLTPYNSVSADDVQREFRRDYEHYEAHHGQPTWMHLIREEVAELFDTHSYCEAVDEAVQVAALCVSLVEHLLESKENMA